MKTFEEFVSGLSEMAYETGITNPSNAFTEFKQYWNTNYKNNHEQTKILLNNIGSQHYRLVKAGSRLVYLVSIDNEYLGVVQYDIHGKTLIISGSHSDLPRGFYNIMFTSLLSLGWVDEILSDVKLSTNAIDSYQKLHDIANYLVVRVISDSRYEEFSRDVLKSKQHARVSVKEKHYNNIHETFLKYNQRITDTTDVFCDMFKNHSPYMDNFLFCENWVD